MKKTALIGLIFLILGGLPLAAQVIVSLGTHTGAGSTNVLLSTSTTSNRYSRTMSIYTAAEIISAGGMAGIITSLAWDKGGTGEYLTNDAYIKVYLKHAQDSVWSTSPVPVWDTEVIGATEVFTSSTYSLPAGTGWAAVPFTTPFVWNGTDHIVVMVEWDRASTPTASITWGRSTTTNANATRVGSTSLSALVMLVNSSRPLLQLSFIPGTSDAGLEGFVNLQDTICEGITPITVTLKNHGPNSIATVDLEWKVNNVAQPTYNWSGSLAVNATTDVTIGSYPFAHGNNYSIIANTKDPNSAADTINHNDTIIQPEVFVKPSPSITLNDTLLNICQGDTAVITGTLSGTAPWDLILSDGTTNIPVTNLTSPSFTIGVSPATTTTYSVTSVSDATGCENTSLQSVTVSVQTAPPAIITPGPVAAVCQGDSVVLMASIGLNFSYSWYRDNVLLPGDTTYILTVKTGGDYNVKVANPTGCSSISNPVTVVIHPLPAVFLGNDTALLPGNSILLDAGPGYNSYIWSTGATSQSLLVDSAGTGLGVKTIWVHVTDNNYCIGGDTITINFTNNPGINDAFANAEIRILPNPSDGRIELHAAQIPSGEYNIELFNTEGKPAHRSIHTLNQDNIINLDLTHLPGGLYLLKLTGSQGSISRRIVIRN